MIKRGFARGCSIVLCWSLLVVRQLVDVRSVLLPQRKVVPRYMRVLGEAIEEWAEYSRLLPRYGLILNRASKECWIASRAAPVVEKHRKKWIECSPEHKKRIVDSHVDMMVDCFNILTEICEDTSGNYQLDDAIYSDLQQACRNALGNDVVLETVGSRARATCGWSNIDLDVDIQVSRDAKSSRANVPFTDSDKKKVAHELKKLELVSNITIGNVAIKFRIWTMDFDLVLWRDRPEMFPALRGGRDFYRNSAGINAFFDDVRAAKAAARGLRHFLPKRYRPKGILLDAITWRVASNGRFRLAQGGTPMRHGAINLFLTVMQELVDWENSCFGSDLMHDLSLMSERERQKYMPGLTNMYTVELDVFLYEILTTTFCHIILQQYEDDLDLLDNEAFFTGRCEAMDRLRGLYEQAFSE
ncbi:unnamed protein product [Symbiodinium natans]|uniref:Polymerase nucleotidyl transferase domain-containing protein n=1 Tax=Symbiodinium natans TaxID=878477 RepID=A0A812V2C7_9DINO|nr:unnamed protein product [Symbiodinium natans]